MKNKQFCVRLKIRRENVRVQLVEKWFKVKSKINYTNENRKNFEVILCNQ